MYDVNYFIKKFEAIPEMLWFSGDFVGPNGTRCALGHCGTVEWTDSINDEEAALIDLFTKNSPLQLRSAVGLVNDGKVYRYPQPTPKQRILAALYDIREETIKAGKVNKTEGVAV